MDEGDGTNGTAQEEGMTGKKDTKDLEQSWTGGGP